MLTRWATLLIAGLLAWPASSQWGPVHGGDDDAGSAPGEGSSQAAAGPAEAAGIREEDMTVVLDLGPASAPGGLSEPWPVVVGVVGGYWGLGAAEGKGFSSSPTLGLRAELDPIDWLPVELWHLWGGRSGGTPVVSSGAGYAATALLAGWQYARGPTRYALSAGAAATFHWVTHQVVDEGTQTLSAAGWSFGPVLSGAMKLRLGAVEARVEVSGIWRGRQLDLLATVGVGWILPFGGGRE